MSAPRAPHLRGRDAAPELKKGRPPRHVAFIERHEARGFACVPTRSKGRVLGTLAFGRHGQRAKPFEAGELELLQILADRAAQAVENSVLLEEVSASAARSRALVEVTRTFAQTAGDCTRLLH